MKTLIIPPDIVDKLKSIEFPKWNVLNPVKGTLNDKDIFWLPANLMDATYTDIDGKEQLLFVEVLSDFESCDIKDIDTIEVKFYDVNGNEIIPKNIDIGDHIIQKVYEDVNGNKLNMFGMQCKTILTEKIIIK